MITVTKVILKNSKRQEKKNTFREKMLSFIAFGIVFLSLSNKKGNFTFEDFLNCFMPIFDLPEKYQFYKFIKK